MQHNIRILIAEDDPDAQDLLAAQLRDDLYQLDMCDSGEEVLEKLKLQSHAYDVVLLDLKLQGMSGLDCLKAIKAQSQHLHLPVILQTSLSDRSFVSDALQSGAFYFMEKTSQRSVLCAVIHSAMETRLRFLEVENQRNALQSGLQFVEDARFRIRTLDDLNKMTPLISSAYPDPDRVTIGIHELLTNAIEHGNLGISYETKTKLILEDKWRDEIERRLDLPDNINKTVEIHLERLADRIVVTITDQGSGFDCSNFMEIDPTRLFDPHGRGIAMAKSMSFDDLIYIGCGNQVQATLILPKED